MAPTDDEERLSYGLVHDDSTGRRRVVLILDERSEADAIAGELARQGRTVAVLRLSGTAAIPAEDD